MERKARERRVVQDRSPPSGPSIRLRTGASTYGSEIGVDPMAGRTETPVRVPRQYRPSTMSDGVIPNTASSVVARTRMSRVGSLRVESLRVGSSPRSLLPRSSSLPRCRPKAVAARTPSGEAVRSRMQDTRNGSNPAGVVPEPSSSR